MLTRLEKAQQRWGGSHNVIDNWLNERQQILVNYCQLAGLPPYENDERALPDTQEVKQFCQLLMDYLSAGHFEIYDQVVAQCKDHGENSLALAKQLYPEISKSTDIALNFNDKYAEIEMQSLTDDFDNDLSHLGQHMEKRFELEDMLIETLFSKHTG
jgi:regulator of sigma D